MDDKLPRLVSQPEKEPWVPPRGWITKDEPSPTKAKKRRWPIVIAVLAGLWVLGVLLPDSDSGPSTDSVTYNHFVDNDSEQRVRFALEADGEIICARELSSGFTGSETCSFKASAGSHHYVMEVLYADGTMERDSWTMNDREIGFFITPWGLEPRTG